MKAGASPALPVTNQELAEGIRGLVEGMPKIDTKRHELKQQLAAQFTRQVDQTQGLGQDAGRAIGTPAAEVPSKAPGQDAER